VQLSACTNGSYPSFRYNWSIVENHYVKLWRNTPQTANIESSPISDTSCLAELSYDLNNKQFCVLSVPNRWRFNIWLQASPILPGSAVTCPKLEHACSRIRNWGYSKKSKKMNSQRSHPHSINVVASPAGPATSSVVTRTARYVWPLHLRRASVVRNIWRHGPRDVAVPRWCIYLVQIKKDVNHIKKDVPCVVLGRGWSRDST